MINTDILLMLRADAENVLMDIDHPVEVERQRAGMGTIFKRCAASSFNHSSLIADIWLLPVPFMPKVHMIFFMPDRLRGAG